MNTLTFSNQLVEMTDTLRLFTKRFTNNDEESRDLVQDTILKALTYRHRFMDNTNLKGWLYTIMRNIFINNYRRKKRTSEVHDNTESQYYLNVADDVTSNFPVRSLEFKELTEIVESTKEEFLRPFQMYVDGYHYHEIAEELGIPLGTVKTRIFYARKDIKKKIKNN